MPQTGIVEYKGFVPNGNRIVFKLECDHPNGGSHYGRVYPPLFRAFTESGRLRPGMRALETSTGSAGISFGLTCKSLGYRGIVAVPKTVDDARIDAIEQTGVEIVRTEGDYVNGFLDFLKQYIGENPDVAFLNHSMSESGRENTVTTQALESIAYELVEELPSVDFLCVGVGNGSSLIGPARAFKRLSAGTKVVAYEPLQSGVAFEHHKPREYKKLLGIDTGTLPQHTVFGLSYKGIPFPHIRLAYRNNLVDETWLVSDLASDWYYCLTTGRDIPRHLLNIPRWDDYDLPYGRSTRAGFAVAMEIAKRENNKTLVVVAYDKPERYDV